jgi:hypothetical protein
VKSLALSVLTKFRHPGIWPDSKEQAQCRAELRALLAVAKAANIRHNPRAKWCDAVTLTTECKVCIALAKLERVSNRKERA